MFFLKFTILSNMEGYMGELVIYVPIKQLPDNDFHCVYVPGLTHGSHIGLGGYIVFVKNRSGNTASSKWFHLIYVIPQIKDSIFINMDDHQRKKLD